MGTGRLYDLYTYGSDASGNTILNKINNGSIVKQLTFNGYSPGIGGILRKSTGELYVAGTNSISGERHVYKFVNDVYSLRIDCKFGTIYETDGSGPHCLAEDRNGAIWVAGYNIYKIENDTITKAFTIPGNIENINQIICARKSNTIFIRTKNGIYKIVNDILSTSNYNNVNSFVENMGIDKDDNIFCVINQGTDLSYIVKLDTDLTLVKSLSFNIYRYGRFFLDKKLNMYLVDYQNIYRIDADGNQLDKYTHYGTTQYDYNNPGGAGSWGGDIVLDNDNVAYFGIIKISLNTKISSPVNYLFGSTASDMTGMQWEIRYNSKFNLIQDSTTIKTFNGTSFTTIGSLPVTDTMFETYGFTDFSGLTKDKLASLTSSKILTKKTDSTSTNTKYTGTPLSKVVIAKNDITLSDNTSKIDKFALTATSTGSSNLRIAFSLDSGTTWKSYKSNILTNIDISNLNDFKTNGNTLTEFNAITDWNTIISNKKIRFAYYLETNNITDTVYTDLLTMQVDMNGIWKLIDTPDYQYYYGKDNELTINLLSDGDYRLNV